MQRKYRLASHVGGVRVKLAKMIVAALKAQDITARCDPKALWPAYGYWRNVQQDVMSWEGYCEVKSFGKWNKRSLGSWDRMSTCIKGLKIDGDGFGYEVYAIHDLAPRKRFGIMRKRERL